MALTILYGLAAAITWGTADFCARKAAEAAGFWLTLWGMNLVGLGLLAVGHAWLPGAFWPLSRTLLLAGAGNTLAGLFFYYALEHGPLVLVSPITAAYPAVSALVAWRVGGERLIWPVGLAVAGVIAGTMIAAYGGPAALSVSSPAPRQRGALAAAAIGALIYGVVFYFLAHAATGASALQRVFAFRLCGAVLLGLPLLLTAGRRRPRLLRPNRRRWAGGWLLLTGALDTIAYLSYVEGARFGPVAVMASLSGLFTVWTIVLALLFLGERLNRRQAAGVVLIVLSVLALACRSRRGRATFNAAAPRSQRAVRPQRPKDTPGLMPRGASLRYLMG